MADPSVFQQIPKEQWLYESECYFIITDKFPTSPGHLLIISKELRENFFELTDHELEELPFQIHKAKEIIEKSYSPDGYNIGINNGSVAGQTVFHFHCHVIPRYQGDMKDPRGGVRHSIEGKGYY